MEIRQLKYFLEVRRTGSISLAAGNLSLTQPALSQQIQLLERELKVTLFERSRRGVSLTEQGEQLAQKAEKLLQGFEELQHALRPGAMPVSVSFAVGETLAAHFVPPLMVALRQLFPGVRFRVVEGNLTEIKAALREGKVDFALAPESLEESTYSNRYLLEDEILPVVSRSDALASRRPEWDKLRGREWILFHPGSAIRKISDTVFAETERRFAPKISMELRSVAGAVRCLEAGLGVGFISDLSLTPNLVPLRVAALARRRRFFLVHRQRNTAVQPVTEAILRFAGDWKA